MIKSIRALFSVFLQLLSLDLAVFLPTYTKRLIDFFIYVAVNVLVMGYLLTRVGMPANFGMFIVFCLVVYKFILSFRERELIRTKLRV